MNTCNICQHETFGISATIAIPIDCRKFSMFVDWSGFRTGVLDSPVWNAFISAWQTWQKVIGIDPHPTSVKTMAMGIIQFLPPEKVGGALATATMSDGTCRQRTISFNNTYPWQDELKIAHKVMLHEFGHFIGLPHYIGSEPSIMKSISVDGLQPIDIVNAVSLGYADKTPPPPAKKVLTIEQMSDLLLDFSKKIGQL
jgi:hypothetical protein